MSRTAFGLATAGFAAALFAAIASGAGEPNLRSALSAVPVTAALGGGTTRALTSDKAFTFLAANARAERQRPFFFGNRLFNTNWVEFPGSVKAFDGLGPTFNRTSCSGCHVRDGRGRPPQAGERMESMLVRLSVRPKDGAAPPVPHPAYGDQLNERAILGVPPEGRVEIEYRDLPGRYADDTPFALREPSYRFRDLAFGPLDGGLFSPRVAPAVIGLGLLESVPISVLEALADPDDADGDGISGRINWLDKAGGKAAGRFGWKANVESLREQAAGAALGDIGLTTSLLPRQNCPAAQTACRDALVEEGPEMDDSFLDRLVVYVRLLAVPAARGFDRPDVERGRLLFGEFGCAACHMPTLRTDSGAALPELRDQVFHPFTDLLLHDMGEGLADGRPDGSADGSEWRTPPLWGLGLIERVNGHHLLLHDGRARGPAEAILWHGGEAEASREAFRKAAAADRAALIAFLESL